MEGKSHFIYKSLHNIASNRRLGLGMSPTLLYRCVTHFDEESPFKMHLQVSVFDGCVWLTLSALSSVARNFLYWGRRCLAPRCLYYQRLQNSKQLRNCMKHGTFFYYHFQSSGRATSHFYCYATAFCFHAVFLSITLCTDMPTCTAALITAL